MTRRRDLAPRACAAATGVALLVVLSLRWFTVGAGGVETGSSGWAALSPFAVAFLVVAAIVTVAGRGAPAVGVAAIALAWLVIDLLTRDDALVPRWPAYAGVVLAADLLSCATWSWRVR